jgi:Rps23 Pro-64 3,4-dihydroxylase Tpa1-like proline 4-hydroxylase
MIVQPLNRDLLRDQYANAMPFPFVRIENFLEPSFAAAVAAAYPTFEDAQRQGMIFKAVNEQNKVQITDAKLFPGPVARLSEALASAKFLSDLSYITGISHLLTDGELIGGGMHITGPGGRLDVHVDFNYLDNRKLHRRLNLLLYLNPIWEELWGGHIQLWDKDVSTCGHSFAPVFNRCVIFETSDISFHGVTPVATASPHPRISFACYYYTRQAPSNWKGDIHSTIFKARPNERVRGYVLMPAERLQRHIAGRMVKLKQQVKRLLSSAST